MPAGAERHRTLDHTAWRAGLPGPVASGDLHLWRIDLGAVSSDRATHLYGLLATGERERAARFRFERDRLCYVITRGTLREVLAAALENQSAEALRFRYSDHGKPTLEQAGGLVFNVSHAGGYALIAVGYCTSIGVDLEAVDPTITVENLVERFFAVPEREAVCAMPENQRHEAFFRTWTRKEAFIKAQGEGLGLPLDRFAVSVDFADPVVLEWVDWKAERITDWWLRSFTVAEGLPAAVAVRPAAEYRIRYFTFAEPGIGG